MNGAPRCDVLLGHALFMARDPKQVAKMRPYPPLGTLYAAGVLRRAGYRVALFDAMLEAGPEAFEAALDAERPAIVVLFEDSFNFYSKMCLGTMREAALCMVRAAAARGLPVVVAGSDASDDPAHYLRAGAGAVMVGEAEHTLCEVIERLAPFAGGRRAPSASDQAAALGAVAGLVIHDPGTPDGLRRTAARPPERHPDTFGHPARDLVDMAGYRSRWIAAHGYWSLNLVSTRGCPFHCNWCAKPIWGQRYAMREPSSVAEEIAELAQAHAPDHLWFADDIFGLRTEWTARFGQAVERLSARIPFTVQTRVDLVDEPSAEGLARAGCRQAWLGVESGSQRILDAMEKGIRADAVHAAVARLRRHGIRVGMFIQFGYPGETWTDIERTVALVRETLPDEIGVSVSYPLPGTSFHSRVAAQLGPDPHWSDSRDLAMLFQGTYTTDFYRRLHSLLHRDHAARLAQAGARSDAPAWRIAAGNGSREDGRTAGGRHNVERGGGARAAVAAVAADAADAADAAVAALEAEWRALAAEESRARSAAPTPIGAVQAKPVPDLSGPAN